MKSEPLSKKSIVPSFAICSDYHRDKSDVFVRLTNIQTAVQWLKGELINAEWYLHQNKMAELYEKPAKQRQEAFDKGVSAAINQVLKIVDEAFEDVVKK